jgi:uncharacterized protein YifN (PemK superfamily)
MPIQYEVPPGTILLCDYAMGGFKEPEMTKKRPALVVSPRLRHRNWLCTVVPFSTTPPKRDVPYQCQIELPRRLPDPWHEADVVWAKADMLATVGFKRLDLFRTARDQTGKRKYIQPRLPQEDLDRVRRCIVEALGLSSLTGDDGERIF